MREALAKIEGKRAVFRATFQEFQKHSRKGYPVERGLFVNVSNEQGIEVCDHIWLLKGKQIVSLNLEAGDVIEFYATSRGYWSGYHDQEHYNFGLKFPTKIRKVLKPSISTAGLPLFDVAQSINV